jgi:hypothetical protein
LGEDPGLVVRENGGSSRISEVRDCHVAVLSRTAVIRRQRRRLSDCSAEIDAGGWESED